MDSANWSLDKVPERPGHNFWIGAQFIEDDPDSLAVWLSVLTVLQMHTAVVTRVEADLHIEAVELREEGIFLDLQIRPSW